jgi:hypothetical protein
LVFKNALHKKSLSLRSRRKHKAWGASPRIRSSKDTEARENGRQREISSLSPAITGSRSFYWHVNLGLAPQALCLRLLSQAKKYHSISFFVKAGLHSFAQKVTQPAKQA